VGSLWRRWVARVEILVSRLILGVVLGLAVLVPTTVLTVEHTAQSEFCNSCHIMEPYYQSWLNSSHSNVGCIECHYEPGALETVEGKFKALSQLAKYVTRTQGTKPWAEVSDHSCMRSGCHSVRLLEGTIAFGRVKFDHRHHLLETRRGRRLRCTSCHSQIVQGDHITVTASVCFMCHFMPGPDGRIPERTGDCLICHGPPKEPIEVAGAPFEHAAFVERGVACRECHVPVVEGRGTVRRERCHSCHGEAGHLERFGETAFLHEKHVTDHKVECFECHDEIHHGLLPLEPPEPVQGEGCGACHVDTHDANRLLFAGTGAVGVPDRPSRMYQTRVVCSACHTGRSGLRAPRDDAPGDELHGVSHEAVASAGEVDCIHCHGTGFYGMLVRWQGVVGDQLERLKPLLDEVGARLPDEPGGEARKLYAEARQDLRLVALDGSRGAHNVLYAVDVLRATAERLDAARARLEPGSEPVAVPGLPHVSEDGCSACHLGVERDALTVHDRPFSHARHFERGLDCRDCHSLERHGAPAFPRESCAGCHHREPDDGSFDPSDCSACHKQQEAFFAGRVEGFEETLSGMEEEKDCDACHGEPPDIRIPQPKLCVLCHDETYAAKPDEWRTQTAELVQRLERALATPPPGAKPEALQRARAALAAVRADGSSGVHNFPLARRMLGEAADGLR
jgi:nitrate/TMAO reductase-like tetraheme cytochrome c subunit